MTRMIYCHIFPFLHKFCFCYFAPLLCFLLSTINKQQKSQNSATNFFCCRLIWFIANLTACAALSLTKTWIFLVHRSRYDPIRNKFQDFWQFSTYASVHRCCCCCMLCVAQNAHSIWWRRKNIIQIVFVWRRHKPHYFSHSVDNTHVIACNRTFHPHMQRALLFPQKRQKKNHSSFLINYGHTHGILSFK